MAQSTNKKQSNLVDSSSSSAPVPSNTPSSRHTQNEESSMKERHRSDKLVKKTDSKSQSSNEDKSESSSQSKVLKINLPNGQIHSALIRANLTLKDIIEKLCDTRTDLNVDKYHIRDKNGNDLDLSIQLTDLKHSEIDFCHPKDSNLQQEGSLGGRRTPSFVAPLEAIDAATKLDPNLRKRLTEIAQKMRNKQTGVQIKTRKVRLRNFYKCFVASEAVKWLEDNLKISKSEAIALGREMEKEGLIAHVTLSQTFDDSNHLLFRFREDDVVDSLKKSRVEKLNIQGIKRDEDESAVTPKTGTADSAYYYSTFWFASQDPILANKPRPDLQTSMLLQALSSYVPRLVLRRFVRKHSPLICPESEEYPACVLFADISGFTPLAEKLAKLGSRGVEQLTTILNEYFGQIINLIHNHGGDIVKFAGDALLAIWPSVNEQGLLYSVALAAQCAMAMQEYFCEFKVSEEVLTLHVGIGAGMISGIHVGGVGARIEFLIAGEPLNQVSECERLAQPGEVYISRQAAKYIFDRVELSVDIVKDKEIEVKDPKRKEKPKKKIVATLDDGTPCYRLEKVKELLELPPTFLMPVYDSTKDLISAYVQPAVLGHLNSGSTEFLAELRPISVIFVNLGFSYSPGALTKIQEAMCAMQQAVATYEGTVRQFIVDDKGCAFIAAFGLPPLSHEDDPLRAVRTAIMIQKNLKALNISSSIGVTTGKAFCGAIGSEERREYAMVGDIVNLSARLMVKANGNILVDRPTYESSRGAIRFNVLPPVMVKGKTTPVEIFSPVKEAEHRPTTGHNSLRSTIRLVRKRTEGRRNVTINLSNVGRLEKATAPLVGRKNELDQLSKVIDLSNNPSLDDEDARVILVEGEAGIGKTRVLQEVQNMCEEKKVKCIVGFGNTVEQSTPYHAWREVFTVLLNMEDYILLDIPQRQERLSKLLEEYVPEMASCVPLLNAVIPLDIPENEKTAAMAGQLRADNLQVLLLKILQACEFSVIMLENAQLMDSASWGLVLAASQSM
jgi:class 3 adenylate cyclase